MNSLVLRKNGGFYSVYGKDCYILYYLLDYKIIDDKVGFLINAFDKVANTLESNHINYIASNKNLDVNYKRKNNYNTFLILGKKKCSLNYRINPIIEKINNLDEKEIDDILNLIEEKL